MMGAPPSYTGFDQERVIVVLVLSPTFRPAGGPGGSEVGGSRTNIKILNPPRLFRQKITEQNPHVYPKSCRFLQNSHRMHSPIGSLAATGLQGLLGSPRPTSFSAFTLNWYSWLGIKLATFKRLSEIGLFVHGTQRTALFSFLSRMYPVIDFPPSFSGGAQTTVISSLLTWNATAANKQIDKL